VFALVDAFGSHIDRFLVGPARPFIVESLDRLQIDPARRQPVKARSPAFDCEVLLSAAIPDVYSPPPRWAVERVRSMFPAPEGSEGAPRVYVARGATPRRRVVNEDEVRELLGRRGFVTVSMDGRSVAEQAAIFAAAEVVVSVHGAALTNLVFARPHTRVVELLPANDPKPLFWHLARVVDADYEVVVGTEPALRRQHDVWMNDADVVVDLAELGRVVG
jgi:capsular polysaccharide biosynthesis protein